MQGYDTAGTCWMHSTLLHITRASDERVRRHTHTPLARLSPETDRPARSQHHEASVPSRSPPSGDLPAPLERRGVGAAAVRVRALVFDGLAGGYEGGGGAQQRNKGAGYAYLGRTEGRPWGVRRSCGTAEGGGSPLRSACRASPWEVLAHRAVVSVGERWTVGCLCG